MSALSALLQPASDVAEHFWRGFLYRVYRGMTLNWFQRWKWKLDIPQTDRLVMTFRRSTIIAELWRP